MKDLFLTRRQALLAMGAMALSSQVPVYAAQSKPGMALQLYTLRDPAKADLKGTLKKVREMGWEYVQWSGMPKLSAEEIRGALDEAGLKAIACHCGVEPFEKNFDAEVAFWKKVGVAYAGPGGMMGDCKGSLGKWMQGAKRLDAVGAKMKAQGLTLLYHNHAWELEKFEGDPRAKLDILLEETGTDNLIFELDLAWLSIGGVDPAAYIRKYQNRCPIVHAKDHAPIKGNRRPRFMPLGQGTLDWDGILKAGTTAGVEWYIYEQDSGRGDPFEYTNASYEFLAKKIKI